MTWLLVCHDAGGSEVVSSWAAHHPEHRYLALAEGPAAKVFARKLPAPSVSREQAFGSLEVTRVLTGSSWGSDLEKLAVRHFRARGVPVATFLDSWMNYPARFALADEVRLPDEVWVGDEHAEAIARRELAGATVRRMTNHYLADIAAEIRGLSAQAGPGDRVLYVSEPTSAAAVRGTGDPRALGYTEFEALEGFLRWVAGQRAAVRLRLHPAEPAHKYDELLRRHDGLSVEVSAGRTLAEDCGWATRVVGCDSMVMAMCVLAGKPVLCAIPTGGRALTLPFPEIVRLFPA